MPLAALDVAAIRHLWRVDSQPERDSIFGWLYVVALHEAYRLSAGERREVHLECLGRDDASWDEVIADPRTAEGAHDALEALRTLAALARASAHRLRPQGRRLQLHGDPGPGPRPHYTNVNKSLAKARVRLQGAHRSDIRGGAAECRRSSRAQAVGRGRRAAVRFLEVLT